MLCKAKVAVCSEIRTKAQKRKCENHVEFLNVKPVGTYVKKSRGFER